MIFVFEDNGNSVFSKLFRSCYKIEFSSDFIYSESICKAHVLVTNLLEHTSDNILLFMDLVPDNIELRRLYLKLRILSIKNNYRLIIIPIPCVEYEFIKSVSDLVDNEYVSTCVNYEPYFHLINKFKEPSRIKSFEKFCKNVVKEKLLKCMSTNTDVNPKYTYYSEDCKVLTLLEKSNEFVKQFPLFPRNSSIEDKVSLDYEEVWDIHRYCINEYNKAVNMFNARMNTDKYKLVSSIR